LIVLKEKYVYCLVNNILIYTKVKWIKCICGFDKFFYFSIGVFKLSVMIYVVI
jgi:hypothetical protein